MPDNHKNFNHEYNLLKNLMQQRNAQNDQDIT